MDEVIKEPTRLSVLREGWTVLELPKLLVSLPHLALQARGRSGRVLVLPGFGTGDGSTTLLRAYLRYLGYQTDGWGLGINRGDVPKLLPRVVTWLDAEADAFGGPINLIGWSLGGYLAREAARERPHRVRQVITLGTPVIGGPKYTTTARFYRSRGVDLDEIERAVERRNQVPLRVPVTAFYSRGDGVVSWQACIDSHSPNVDHVEVLSTHIGLGINPRVWGRIAEKLQAAPSVSGA